MSVLVAVLVVLISMGLMAIQSATTLALTTLLEAETKRASQLPLLQSLQIPVLSTISQQQTQPHQSTQSHRQTHRYY